MPSSLSALTQERCAGKVQEVGVARSWCRRKFVTPGAVLGRPGAPILGYELYCVHSLQPEFSLIREDRNW